MKGRKRHLFVRKILRFVLGPALKRKFGFEPEIAELPGPCLIFSNHTTNWDPLLLSLSFREQVYFVASEHIFRWGILSRLIVWLQSPIARLKGTVGAGTAAAVMRRLRKGCSVCIFIEGDCSWNGRTGSISPAAAKLARSCGAALVTYKFTGGYLTGPRWALKLRRGKMRGEIKGVYSPEDIRKMPVDRIERLISDDLSEDAYERQRENPVVYRGKNYAEHLETVLFICPFCSGVGTLFSNGNEFHCSCGLFALYDDFGFLTGPGLPFDNVAKWDDWQTDRLRLLPEESGDGPVFEDVDITLREIFPDHSSKKLGAGSISMFIDRLVCAGADFPLSSVFGMAVHGRNTIDMSADKRNFEISGGKLFCGRKYLLLYDQLRQQI